MFQSLFYPLQTKFLDTVNTLCGRVPQVFLKQIEKTIKAAFEQKVIRHARPPHKQRRWIAAVYKWQGKELILQKQRWCFEWNMCNTKELGVVSWPVFSVWKGWCRASWTEWVLSSSYYGINGSLMRIFTLQRTEPFKYKSNGGKTVFFKVNTQVLGIYWKIYFFFFSEKLVWFVFTQWNRATDCTHYVISLFQRISR